MSANTQKIFLLLIALIVSLLLLVSCTGTRTYARGWAGVSEVDDTLVFASMTGNVYSVDSVTGTVLGDSIKMVVAASGGLGCIPSCSGQQTTAIAIYSSPGVAGDLVYIGGYDGKVYAYQLVDGKLKEEPLWTYPREGNLGASIIGGLTVANDKLYFSSANGTVYALTAAEGYKEWSYNIGKKIWSAPTVEGDTLYIGSFDKKIYALDATTGVKKWEFETGGAISATPLVKDGLVYIGSYDRHIYALDTDGKLVWQFPPADMKISTAGGVSRDFTPNNWFWAKPIIHGDTLYAPCLDGKVYALHAQDGGLIEVFDVKEAVTSSPVLVDNTLIVATTDLAKKTSRVYAIDTSNRSQPRELTSLTTEGINAPLFASNGIVYIHTTKDSFYGLNALNGALQKFSLTTSK